jgi:organic radical activating enzyme
MISIPIHEIFGPTVQGEGHWAGALVDFIRLHGCPVGCPWCDTGYSEGGKDIPRAMMDISSILGAVRSNRIVISGGEPFIHPSLPALVESLTEQGKSVHIETSGSFWQKIDNSCWVTLSPKAHINSRYPVVNKFWRRANEVKLVIETGDEIDSYKENLESFNGLVFLQPQWKKHKESIHVILKLLEIHPEWRLSVQTHKFIGVQ